MKFTEKDFIQAKHRLEEAQARNRVKERAARTHRLIQEGAILEKAMPQVRHSFIPKGALTHHCQNSQSFGQRWYFNIR